MKCSQCKHEASPDKVYPGWYHCTWCLEDFPSDEVLLDHPVPYQCHWCERETPNPLRLWINGEMNRILATLCDRCQAADEEADEIIRERRELRNN